ncbi:amidohydrolase family protein [Falsiroseomonas oryziterrae]|uniref:amidohydrolase family protein n=1 Tax=Falsiroseomonas oryziterrae TaxID=2911368 RepID=UPI001F382AA9|nr:amidohydrolase family protein [Roseomonas sp. NPKOSM-4]
MLILRGGWVLTDPAKGTVLRDGAVRIEDGRVAETGDAAALIRRFPAAEVIGGPDDIVMPGLIDAHSHGRGLSPIQKGVLYDYLENAFLEWSTMAYLPNELCAALSAVRHLRYGCTTIHHTGWNDEGPHATAEARKAILAYREAGIRLAYSPGVRNRNKFCVDEQAFAATLPPDLADFVRPFVSYDANAIEHGYMEQFEALHADFDGPMSRIFHGPSWAHGTTERFFGRVRDSAQQKGGIPIHIHTLQTPHQRAYGLKAFGKSLVAYLDELGLLGPNVTLGHAVWLTEADIALLAERGASTTHHASCNLHVRNGISPIHPMIRAGVNVAMGIDDKSINDDDDPFMELRLASMLARVPGFDLGAETRLTAGEVLAMGTVNAARTLGFGGQLGTLAPGMLADAVVLGTDEMLRDPWTSERLSVPDLILLRAKGSHTRHAVVDGKVVLRDGRIVTMDVEALYREIRAWVAKHQDSAADPRKVEMIRRLKPHFHAWHRDMLRHLDVSVPHYMMNGAR